MKVTILQQDITWAQPSVNVAAANRAIDTHPGADLYVLPEMFATGFVTQPEGIAEPIEGHTLAWMQKKAQAIQAAIAGSLAVTDGQHYFNRFYFVHPDGHVDYYDKRHLFTYGGEDKHFTAGNTGCRKLPWNSLFARSVLRPAFPRMEPTARRLRCSPLCGQLAHSESSRMADPITG